MNKIKISLKFFILSLIVLKLGYTQHFGLGIILGSPTGFTLRGVFTRNSAFAVNIGWSLAEPHKLHITGDYQFLFPTVIKWEDEISGEKREIKDLTPYLGIGGRFKFKEVKDNNTELNMGIRMGGGVEYQIKRFSIFLEIYPIVNIYPSTNFDLEGGIGFRFYFI